MWAPKRETGGNFKRKAQRDTTTTMVLVAGVSLSIKHDQEGH